MSLILSLSLSALLLEHDVLSVLVRNANQTHIIIVASKTWVKI